jgi:hypothetical protein
MFNIRKNSSQEALHERLLRDNALREAHALFESMGADAIDQVTDRLRKLGESADERRHERLIIVELERLERLERKGPAIGTLVIWKPPLLSLATLRRLLGRRR